MDIFESIGFINFYGFSPSFDLLEGRESSKKVLLVGSSEMGHILKTQSDHPDSATEYYIYEK